MKKTKIAAALAAACVTMPAGAVTFVFKNNTPGYEQTQYRFFFPSLNSLPLSDGVTTILGAPGGSITVVGADPALEAANGTGFLGAFLITSVSTYSGTPVFNFGAGQSQAVTRELTGNGSEIIVRALIFEIQHEDRNNIRPTAALSLQDVTEYLGRGPLNYFQQGFRATCTDSSQTVCRDQVNFIGRGTLTFVGIENAVPEPATWAMMLFGFGGLGYTMRRRPKGRTRIRFA